MLPEFRPFRDLHFGIFHFDLRSASSGPVIMVDAVAVQDSVGTVGTPAAVNKHRPDLRVLKEAEQFLHFFRLWRLIARQRNI